jgi:hypothetical protein
VAADAGKIKNMELTEILNYIFGRLVVAIPLSL